MTPETPLKFLSQDEQNENANYIILKIKIKYFKNIKGKGKNGKRQT